MTPSLTAALLGAVVLVALPAVAATTFETKVYDLPADTNVSSVATAPDGKIWFTGRKPGALGILDPVTKQTRFISLGKGSAPYMVHVGKDGSAWLTDTGQNAIARVNVATGEVKLYPVPQDLGFPNIGSFVIDNEGTVWFAGTGPNGPGENKGVYGRLNPTTGEVNIWKPPEGRGASGIAATKDGDVWFISVGSSYIARIDKETGAAHVVKTPHEGAEPHCLWADSKGNLWVDEWTTGYLSRYTPKTGKWKSWPVPGERPSHAYAVYVDEKDVAWVAQRAANMVYAFDTKTEKFIGRVPATKAESGVRQITGSPGTVYIPEAGTNRIVQVLTGPVKSASR